MGYDNAQLNGPINQSQGAVSFKEWNEGTKNGGKLRNYGKLNPQGAAKIINMNGMQGFVPNALAPEGFPPPPHWAPKVTAGDSKALVPYGSKALASAEGGALVPVEKGLMKTANVLNLRNISNGFRPPSLGSVAGSVVKGGVVGTATGMALNHLIPKADDSGDNYWGQVANEVRDLGIDTASGAAGGYATGAPVLGAVIGAGMNTGGKLLRVGSGLNQMYNPNSENNTFLNESKGAVSGSNETIGKKAQAGELRANNAGYATLSDYASAIRSGEAPQPRPAATQSGAPAGSRQEWQYSSRSTPEQQALPARVVDQAAPAQAQVAPAPAQAAPAQAQVAPAQAQVAPKGSFNGPSADEMAEFRRQTGTRFDPVSVNDKLNLERMRGHEETFDSKQANAYRAANPYRPGQYTKGH